MDIQTVFLDVLPSLITGFVSVLALITSYKSAENASRLSYSNNIDNMRFAQKEKVADQLAEKAAALLTKSDPNVLNTVINEIVPRQITHEENARIRRNLLKLADEIQTLSNVIKMLAYSVLDSQEFLDKIEDIGNKLDIVSENCSAMLLKLTEIYTAVTPEGSIKSINIMEEIQKMEKDFISEYREKYIQLFLALSNLIWYIRQQSVPKELRLGTPPNFSKDSELY